MANELAVNYADLNAVAGAIIEKSGNAEGIVFPDGFVSAIQNMQSGGGLNFEIVGGTEQPENPKENTIWVATDAKITGWEFNPNEPETKHQGMIWFRTETTGETQFNALKENAIYIKPSSAKQYADGAWNDVPATIYQNGEWIEFEPILWIFKERAGVSKGFTVTALMEGFGFDVDDEKITISTQKSVGGQLWIEPQINLAPYEKLYVEMVCEERYANQYTVTVGVGPDVPAGQDKAGSFDSCVQSIFNTTRNVVEVPIGNISATRYIKIASFAVTGYIYNIWLK